MTPIKRNKKKHLDKDLHIRISEKNLNLIKAEAQALGVTIGFMARMIIEQHYMNISKNQTDNLLK